MTFYKILTSFSHSQSNGNGDPKRLEAGSNPRCRDQVWADFSFAWPKKGLPLTRVVSQKFYKKSRFILDPCQNKIMEIVFTVCIRLYSRFPYVSNFPICIQTILTYSVFRYAVFEGVPLSKRALWRAISGCRSPRPGGHIRYVWRHVQQLFQT